MLSLQTENNQISPASWNCWENHSQLDIFTEAGPSQQSRSGHANQIEDRQSQCKMCCEGPDLIHKCSMDRWRDSWICNQTQWQINSKWAFGTLCSRSSNCWWLVRAPSAMERKVMANVPYKVQAIRWMAVWPLIGANNLRQQLKEVGIQLAAASPAVDNQARRWQMSSAFTCKARRSQTQWKQQTRMAVFHQCEEHFGS